MKIKAATLNLEIEVDNSLYKGCQLEEVAGRWRVKDYSEESINIIGRNAEALAKRFMSESVEELTLTGATAIWVYLIVFHSVAHRFKTIYYDNGQPNGRHRIAAH